MDKISTFYRRLKKISIEIEMCANYPWIYLDKVNGKKIKEKQWSDHGFTLAMSPIRVGQELKFHDIGNTFKVMWNSWVESWEKSVGRPRFIQVRA